MSKVVSFEQVKKDRTQVNPIFDEMINDCERVRKENIDFYRAHYKDLDKLEDVIIEMKKNGINPSCQSRFIEVYNFLKSKSDNYVDTLFPRLDFTYLFSVDNHIIKEDNNYIGTIIAGFDENMSKIDIAYKPIVSDMIHKLRNPIIKKFFTKHDKSDIDLMTSAILNSFAGDDIEDISRFLDYNSTTFESLDNGIITIPKIYNYYRDLMLALLSTPGLKVTIPDRTRNILDINSFEDKDKNVYIKCVQDLRKISNGAEDELLYVYDLTDIFKHFKESIDTFEIEELLNMTVIRSKGIMRTRDIDEINEELQSKEKKHENR